MWNSNVNQAALLTLARLPYVLWPSGAKRTGLPNYEDFFRLKTEFRAEASVAVSSKLHAMPT